MAITMAKTFVIFIYSMIITWKEQIRKLRNYSFPVLFYSSA